MFDAPDSELMKYDQMAFEDLFKPAASMDAGRL
jgi:hypothetical protein